MTLVACGLLALGVLAYMISPMLDGSARRLRTARSAGSLRDDLLKKKDFIYSSIRELNIDYNMGKLAAEDHEALRQEYMKEASDVLDELDRTAVSDLPVEEQIEEAVREIRQLRGPASEEDAAADNEAVPVDDEAAEVKAVGDEAAGDLATADEAAENVRPADGPPAEDARPAPSARVQECRICRTVNEQSARFCIECGASLKIITCAGCGAENPGSARFCAQCGGKLN